jgi:DHA2 family multidrug resistance protein
VRVAAEGAAPGLAATAAPLPADTYAAGAGKWLVVSSVMLGTFLSVMDVSVVNVAMPHMMGSFGEDLITITWVSTAYSIAEIIMVTMSAWWATILGRKRLFLASMILFTAGSVLAGTSRTFGQMLAYRVMQGIGGGSLIPCSQAIARETFPPAEQGMAMAIFAMGVTLAPAIGPVLGGWLVDNYGWQWVFYINVPFCIAGVIMVSAFVHDPPYLKRGFERIDWFGIVLLTAGLTALQVVLERGEEVDWFASHWIVAGAATAAVALVTLIIWELRSPEPIINLRLFRNPALRVGATLGALVSFVLFGSTFLLPQLTQDLLDYPAFQAGMVLLPRVLIMLVVMPIAGRLYNYVSPRLLVGTGLCLLILAQWQLAHFLLGVGFWSFAVPLCVLGAGLGMMMVNLSTVTLSSMPRANMTAASGLYTLSRRVSGNIAYAVLATIVDRRTQFHRASLIGNVTSLNRAYWRSGSGFATLLFNHGVNSVAAHDRALAMVNGMLNRQATMMAYNDANYLSVMMALITLPLVLLLPRSGLAETQASSELE